MSNVAANISPAAFSYNGFGKVYLREGNFEMALKHNTA
jgi:hypothetical protein